MLLFALMLGSAQANDDLNFAPDRPGLGDSTSTPGRGHWIGQVGVLGSLGEGGTTVSSSGWMLRMGLDEGVELRLRAPDVGVGEGSPTVGTLGVGAMFGGALGERWSSSVVPEVALDPNTGKIGASLNGTVALSLGAVGMWAHASAAGAEGTVSTLAGGGVSLSSGPVGVYANGYHAFGDATYVGGGGWWLVQQQLQLDVGMDVGASDNTLTYLPTLGLSAGW